MFNLQNDKVIIMLAPQAVVSATTVTSGVVDMLDYGNVQVALSVAAATATCIPVSIAFQESDTTDATNFATIVSAGTASTGWKTTTTAATEVSSLTAAWAVYAQPWGPGRKRYLRMQLTGASAAGPVTVAAFATLGRAAISPTGTNVSGTYISTSVGSSYVVAAV